MAMRDTIEPRAKDLGGGLVVRRVLPAAAHRAVGPFVFFDHFGPIVEHPEDQHDVRPHPHIGLATVTYLFAGAMLHRDSTGVVQRIEPGAINLMTAGRGIVHSERAPDDLRHTDRPLHGLQLWLALPVEHEEAAPAFQHVAAAEIPAVAVDGVQVRVLIGEAFGVASPVRSLSPTLFLDLDFGAGGAGAGLTVPDAGEERAVYPIDRDLLLDGEPLPAGRMTLLRPGETPRIEAPEGGRVVVVGGRPLGPRHLVWNFVSSRIERIRQAEDDWAAQRFPTVPGETEFIPLPGRTA